jgi:hypothetical protein
MEKHLKAVVMLAVLTACSNPVPKEMRPHAKEYLKGRAVTQGLAQLNNPATWFDFTAKYANSSPGSFGDLDGYALAQIAPLDVEKKDFDKDVYDALPSALQAREDSRVRSIVLIRWNKQASTEAYNAGDGRVENLQVGRDADVVVIDRARDSIVSAFSELASGAMFMKKSEQSSAKLVPSLVKTLVLLSARGSIPLPRTIPLHAVVTDPALHPDEVSRITIAKWLGTESATLAGYSRFDFAPATDANSTDYINLDINRGFAERCWPGGFGEYALVELAPGTAGTTADDKPIRVLGHFRIDPGIQKVEITLPTPSRLQ